MIHNRETLNCFNSIQAKQKKTIAEISKSVVRAVAILLANARCKNNIGESRAVGACSSQNQGAIEPAIVSRKYRDLSELNECVLETFVDFSIIFNLSRYVLSLPKGDN